MTIHLHGVYLILMPLILLIFVFIFLYYCILHSISPTSPTHHENQNNTLPYASRAPDYRNHTSGNKKATLMSRHFCLHLYNTLARPNFCNTQTESSLPLSKGNNSQARLSY